MEKASIVTDDERAFLFPFCTSIPSCLWCDGARYDLYDYRSSYFVRRFCRR